jgi:2-polyprenyl-3-methyl-5-hydroxy-6-metoxy-1,4-benzoquinol methylase
MSAQDATLQQYHQWMKINATSHLIRSAKQLGILDELRQGQRTLEQLCEPRVLKSAPTKLLLDALVAIGIVEQYAEDYALARAAHLLCQYDDDLGDSRWQSLPDAVLGKTSRLDHDDQRYLNRIAATQWIHTPAAIQAAEVLDVGGDGEPQGISILDLGCGSAVWSCAMAHRDQQAKVTAVDHAEALIAAQSTADSIELNDRFEVLRGSPDTVVLADDAFDLVVLAQRLSCLGQSHAGDVVARAVAACKPGGRVVVIDLFRGPAKANLAETIEALTLDLETEAGQILSLEQTQQLLGEAGLTNIQFTFLAASQLNLGLAIGTKA